MPHGAASRGRIARRRRTDEEGAVRPSSARPVAADQAMLEREQAEALHREIDRLPGDFRIPVVLCYFEGLTLDEAAHRLRWPTGTLRSRLARAREKLRRGLARRGFALSTTALAASLSPRPSSAALSAGLYNATTRAAIALATQHAGGCAVPGPATAPAQEVISTMLRHQIRVTAVSVLFLAFVAASGGWLARRPVMGGEREQVPAVAQGSSKMKADDVFPRPAAGRMTVAGRVLDPDGKPVPNASVMVYGASKRSGDVIRSGSSALRRLARRIVMAPAALCSGCRASVRRRTT